VYEFLFSKKLAGLKTMTDTPLTDTLPLTTDRLGHGILVCEAVVRNIDTPHLAAASQCGCVRSPWSAHAAWVDSANCAVSK